MPINSQINEMIDQLLDEHYKGHDTKKITASQLGFCPLAEVLRLKGHNPKFDKQTNRKYMVGEATHIFLTKLMNFKHREEHLEDEYISGHIDGILNLDGVDYLIEFKTKGLQFKKLPALQHRIQVQVYLRLLKENRFNINKALIIYIEKETGNTIIFEETTDDELQKQIDERIALILALKQLPLNEIEPDDIRDFWEDWMCGYCGYVHACPLAQKLVRGGI